MSEFRLSSILERPISDEHWPQLENIMYSLVNSAKLSMNSSPKKRETESTLKPKEQSKR